MLTDRLSELRTMKRRTHQDMADMLGITRQAYSFYENGKREPDIETLEKLADYFNVSVDYLLGRSNQSKDEAADEGYFAFADGGEGWTEAEFEIAKATIRALREQQARNKNKK